jgi:hypothetical protein
MAIPMSPAPAQRIAIVPFSSAAQFRACEIARADQEHRSALQIEEDRQKPHCFSHSGVD